MGGCGDKNLDGEDSSGGIVSINSDITEAQQIVGGSGVTVSTVSGTTTISATNAGTLTSIVAPGTIFTTPLAISSGQATLAYNGTTQLSLTFNANGTRQNTVTNTSALTSATAGHSGVNDSGNHIDMLMFGSTNNSSTYGANRGVIRAIGSTGLDLSAEGASKRIRLMTSSTERASIGDDGWVLANGFVDVPTSLTGNTTLDVNSSQNFYVTPSTGSITVTLPVVSTLVLGQTYQFINGGTGNLTVKSSGNNTVVIIKTTQAGNMVCVSTSGTTAASWYANGGTGAFAGTQLTVPDGGTGAATLPIHGVLIGNDDGTIQVTATGTSGQILTSNGSFADPTWQDAPSGTNSVSSGATGQTSFTAHTLLVGNGTSPLGSVTNGTDRQVLVAATGLDPSYSNLADITVLPTIQTFTANPTGVNNYTFQMTSANATAGATYTNNGSTYTVLQNLAGGTRLRTSGTGTPQTSGTLTLATGTGDATITFTSFTGLYIAPTVLPKYLKVTVAGGGAGGNGSGNSTPIGTAGTSSSFSGSEIVCNGGGIAGTAGTNGGVGGTVSAAPASGIVLKALQGGNGGGSDEVVLTNAFLLGGDGGNNPLIGGGRGGSKLTAGNNAKVNTGGGGGGGGTNGSTGNTYYGGGGGGAGGYCEAILYSPSKYIGWTIGLGGAHGSSGVGGVIGGDGADGVIIVEEYYQ